MKTTAAATLLALAAWAAPAQAQFQLTLPDDSASIKLGAFTQLQGEALDSSEDDGTAQNLFVRRFRLLLGGRVGERIAFFVDGEMANVGKSDAAGRKNTEVSMTLLDASVTATFSPAFKLDVGQLLVPVSHNSQQGATTLLAVDYGPYTFTHSGPTLSRFGRDWGLQARGLLLSNHLEYRVGVFDGARGEGASRPLRTTVRVAYYPFDAETDFFYAGTYHGAKRVVSFGLSYDHQQDYDAFSGDVFVDLPVGRGDVATFQADWTRYDGGRTFTQLGRQDVALIEASYQFVPVHFGPFLQLSRRDVEDGADEKTWQFGVAYWPSRHRLNVKAALARLERDGAPDRDQAVVQLQVYLF